MNTQEDVHVPEKEVMGNGGEVQEGLMHSDHMLIESPDAISHIRIEEVISSQMDNATSGIDKGRVVRIPLTDCTNHMTRGGDNGQEGIKKIAKGQWKILVKMKGNGNRNQDMEENEEQVLNIKK